MSEPENCQSNYWLQTLILDNDDVSVRDDILKTTNENGIMTRPAWILMDELSPFSECQKMELSEVKLISKRIINIPSSSNLV